MGKEKIQFLRLGTMEKILPEGIVTMRQPAFRSTVTDSPVEGGGGVRGYRSGVSFIPQSSLFESSLSPSVPTHPTHSLNTGLLKEET